MPKDCSDAESQSRREHVVPKAVNQDFRNGSIRAFLQKRKGQRWQVNAMQKLIEFCETVSLNDAAPTRRSRICGEARECSSIPVGVPSNGIPLPVAPLLCAGTEPVADENSKLRNGLVRTLSNGEWSFTKYMIRQLRSVVSILLVGGAACCWVGMEAFCAPLPKDDQSVMDKAWTILQAGLSDKSADKRAQTVSAVGIIPGDKRAIETAEKALDDPSSDVRRAAVIALGQMNSTASLPRIKSLLGHSDAKTIVAIAAVLKKFDDPEGYDIYDQILTGKRKDGGSLLDGLKDGKSLEKMGAETAVGFLPFGGVATGAYDYLKQNGSSRSQVFETAATALADDRDPLAKEALVQAALSGKQAVQVAALRALATRADPTVVTDIEPAMYSDKPLIRYTAAAVILHLLDLRS